MGFISMGAKRDSLNIKMAHRQMKAQHRGMAWRESSSSRATSHIPHGCSWRTKALASNSRKENPKEEFLFVRHANPPVEIRWQLNEYSWRTQTNEHSICKYVQTSLPSDDLAKFQGQPQGKGTCEKKSLRVLENSQIIQNIENMKTQQSRREGNLRAGIW